jgi:GTPase SAR1 family protein
MEDYWFEVVKSNIKEESRLVLIGNKSDLPREVEYSSGKELAEKHKCQFFEASALNQEGVSTVSFLISTQLRINLD